MDVWPLPSLTAQTKKKKTKKKKKKKTKKKNLTFSHQKSTP